MNPIGTIDWSSQIRSHMTNQEKSYSNGQAWTRYDKLTRCVTEIWPKKRWGGEPSRQVKSVFPLNTPFSPFLF